MKKHLLLILALVTLMALPFSSCNGEDDEVENVISENELPSAALDFLDKHFNEVAITKVVMITGSVTVYQVELENGFEVVFNTKGEWQEVDAPYYMTVPQAIIPEPVMQTLNREFSGYGVVEINTTGEGWKVELSTGLNGSHIPGEPGIDIWFNMSGEILQTSQDNT